MLWSTGMMWLNGAHEAQRRGDRRDRQEQRDAGRHQRAEREHEDHEGDRQGQRLRLVQVVLEGLGQGPVGAGVAELLDPQVGVLLLDPVDRGQHRLDVVLQLGVVAEQVERDEGGAPVGEICAALPDASGDWMSRTVSNRDSARTTSLTPAAKRGSSSVTSPRP